MTYQPRSDGFYPILQEWASRIREQSFFAAPSHQVSRVLEKERLTPLDYAALLSPAAGQRLEAMARRSQAETLRHFGLAVQLFAPLYLANICTNRCVYCGFHAGRKIRRSVLDMDAVEAEAKAMAATGLRRVLCLTGDAPQKTGADYIARAVAVLSRYFPSVGIEVQALTEDEYALVARAGAEGMTMFQETYDRELYADLHPAGPKRDFGFRLDAPHRACLGGLRSVTFGALLGLSDWRRDIFMTGLHADWLSRTFPQVDIAVSLPRIRPPAPGEVQGPGFTCKPVTDRELVQALTALRCFLPHAGITISTRESAYLRDKLVPLGVTRVSAGVSTAVGGYVSRREPAQDQRMSEDGNNGSGPVQFVIDDPRGVSEMADALARLGRQAVFADWVLPSGGDLPLSAGVSQSLGGPAAGSGP